MHHIAQKEQNKAPETQQFCQISGAVCNLVETIGGSITQYIVLYSCMIINI